MKKLISGKVLLGIASLLVMVVLSSCLSNDSNVSSRIQVVLTLNNAATSTGSDTTLIAGNDKLTLASVRFFQGRSQLTRQSGSTIPVGPSIARFSTQRTNAGRITGITIPLSRVLRGQRIAGLYETFKFKIDTAPDSLNEQIPGVFYNNGGNYSMIIKGTFNGSDFTFKSEDNFHRQLSLSSPVTIEKTNSSVPFIVTANVRDWFLKTGGQGFLDPSVKSNKSKINQRIKHSFDIKVQSRGTGGSTPEQ